MKCIVTIYVAKVQTSLLLVDAEEDDYHLACKNNAFGFFNNLIEYDLMSFTQ